MPSNDTWFIPLQNAEQPAQAGLVEIGIDLEQATFFENFQREMLNSYDLGRIQTDWLDDRWRFDLRHAPEKKTITTPKSKPPIRPSPRIKVFFGETDLS